MEMNDIAFNLILYSGNARSKVMESLKSARENYFEQAQQTLEEADKALEKAHKVQTDVLQREANGEKTEMSVLFIHAQDHLMTAMLARDLGEEMIALRKMKK